MSERKPAYKVGEDGRLYFTYNQGAEYRVLPPVSAPFTVRVKSCELEESKEYYRIESAGAELPARFSVMQVEIMLGRFPSEEVTAGEPVELPLLSEEVKAYYTAKRNELAAANAKENAKLNGTAYKTNNTVIKKMRENLAYYLNATDGTEKAAELRKKLVELEEEQEKILADKGVDKRLLLKVSDCAKCNDTGMVDGSVCTCATDQAEKIKAFNAARRLLART